MLRGLTRFTVVLLSAVLIAAWLCGCAPGRKGQRPAPPKKQTTPVAKDDKPKSTLNAQFGKARVIWTGQDGKRLWEARFKRASGSQQGDDAELELFGVSAVLYKNGKAVSAMTAPRVMANSKTREVRASGGVKITSSVDGSSAVSDRLTWSAARDRLDGSGGVCMVKGNVTITAQTFRADTALKKTRFTEASLGME